LYSLNHAESRKEKERKEGVGGGEEREERKGRESYHPPCYIQTSTFEARPKKNEQQNTEF